MTKKDYETLAASIREARDDRKCTPDEVWGIDIATTIARNLAKENARFDARLFLGACGFSPALTGGTPSAPTFDPLL